MSIIIMYCTASILQVSLYIMYLWGIIATILGVNKAQFQVLLKLKAL